MKTDPVFRARGEIVRNPSVARLIELGIGEGARLAASGALAAMSGAKTGRCPKDKRVVRSKASESDVWWGAVNIPQEESGYDSSRRRAIEHLESESRLYVVDGYAGWDAGYRLKVRVICALAYHALFMRNMLICPSPEELESFGEPDFLILNAGSCPADPSEEGSTSDTRVALHLERRELVILGTLYAGEMKKGVFTAMNYFMPKVGVLSMHCSANEGASGDVSLFFGLSGTGKTTLSADPRRKLIGDDEHCWSDNGIFNIEGGCYAKCIGLEERSEPEIYRAIRFGSVLENVVIDPTTRHADFADGSVTENTRCAYPIDFISNARIPCVGAHPKNIIFLTCDAFGVLPPVSRLGSQQASEHFLCGYTAKVAGTEIGVAEPEATFSACFGAAFLVWPPAVYAELLAERMAKHGSRAWLVNTGWTGGPFGIGRRMQLGHTRAIIDALHAGDLDDAPVSLDPVFQVEVPRTVRGVPDEVLMPRTAWTDASAYENTARGLADKFATTLSQLVSREAR